MASKPQTASASTASAVPATNPPPGAQQAYERYLAAAQALPASQVSKFHGDANVIYQNMRTGVASVLAQQAQIATDLPKVDVSALTSLPEIGLGLVFASLQARKGAGKNVALEQDLKQGFALRKVMLAAADALAAAGVLQEDDVKKIRAGHGKLDAAQDLIDLAALFQKNAAAVANKTAVTAAQIAQAAALGTKLQAELKPGNAPKPPSPPSAADLRNRFFTLAEQGHDRLLWRPGAYLFGEAELKVKVPALLAHAPHGSAAKKAAKATRAATRADAKAKKAQERAAKVKGKGKGKKGQGTPKAGG